MLFRFASYLLINDTSLLISGPLLLVLVSALGMDVLLANLLSLVLLVVGRFAIADSYICGSKSLGPRRLALAQANGEHRPGGSGIEIGRDADDTAGFRA